MDCFNHLWRQALPAFSQQRVWERARVLGVSALACLGRHTITGMLTTSGQQFVDWTAAYRLFARARFAEDALFRPILRGVLSLLEASSPVVAMMDDTLLRKRGSKVTGAAWRRDPLGPKFHPNLTWSQRFLQVAAVVPEGEAPARARAIPLDLQHCPSAKKPGRRATPQQWDDYEQARCVLRLPVVGVKRLRALREALDNEPGGKERQLVMAVDGGYTNTTLLRDLPERTALIGRVRKDAVLFSPPPPRAGRGRKPCYGRSLPTPEEMRQDAALPWQTVRAYAAGKTHDFEVKVADNVRWRGVGALNMRLVIVRPLAYRLTKNHRLLYRNPAYLLCTDPTLSLQQTLQYYLWRWEGEVAFRDEKTLLGMGEAQVRTAPAIATTPIFIAGLYAYLHLAALQAKGTTALLPRPKWHPATPGDRATTAQLLGQLRTELWGRALGVNLTDFTTCLDHDTKSEKFPPPSLANPFSALGYAIK